MKTEKPEDNLDYSPVSSVFSVKLKSSPNRFLTYQLAALLLTALFYSFFHALRTVWGYSKPYLSNSNPYYTSARLGVIDFVFSISYAFGQYFNGWLGDRVNLKIFLTVGSLCAVLGLSLFGYFEGVLYLNSIFVDALTFILNGLGQSTGFPGSISIVSNWYSSKDSGLGLWGTNLNIGNIFGQQIGRLTINVRGLDWQYSLYITCGILLVCLVVLLIFVKIHPKDLVGEASVEEEEEGLLENADTQNNNNTNNAIAHNSHHHGGHNKGIRFIDAWKIPNVPSFALGFFCVKGVAFGVIFWLPFYLTNQVNLEGDISLLLASIEVGMIMGSIIFGYLSDRIKSKSIMIAIGFFFSVIFLLLTFTIREANDKTFYLILLFLAGAGLGSPASLIGGAVSSDIGHSFKHHGHVNVTSTVTGIMEGCGAVGAAVTQIFVSNFTSITFPFFAALCFIGGVVMIPVGIVDYKRIKSKRDPELNSSKPANDLE